MDRLNEIAELDRKIRIEVLELMRHALRVGDLTYAKELGVLSSKLKKSVDNPIAP